MSVKNWWFLRKKKPEKVSEANTYSTLEKVFIKASHLRVGMYVVELDRPWLDTPFPFQGFELKSEETIQAVKEICDYVYIDMTREKKVQAPAVKRLILPADNQKIFNYGTPPKKLSAFEKEILNTEKVYESSSILVADFMSKIASGGGVDTKLAKQAVSDCVNSVLHSPDAAVWLTQLKHKDEYTAQHSLNVCVLSIVLGRHIN